MTGIIVILDSFGTFDRDAPGYLYESSAQSVGIIASFGFMNDVPEDPLSPYNPKSLAILNGNNRFLVDLVEQRRRLPAGSYFDSPAWYVLFLRA
jgi:hypothetical protein